MSYFIVFNEINYALLVDGCYGVQEHQTALHIAARLGSVDCALMLLDNGATPDAATVEQYTPLHIAAKEGHEDVVQLLLERGANSSLATSVSVSVIVIITTTSCQ